MVNMSNSAERQSRFEGFVSELEALGQKYGVVVRSVGGVAIFGAGDIASVEYDRDSTSGDLIPLSVEIFEPGGSEKENASV